MRFWLGGPRLAGLRTGMSFGPEDFRRINRSAPAAANGMTGGFIYVISDESGRHKIGSARDPIARRATLQTGSADRLTLVFAAAAEGSNYFAVEHVAHTIMGAWRVGRGGDEWFAAPASVAIGAVYEASTRTGHPIQQIQIEAIPRVIALARQPTPDCSGARQASRWGIYACLPAPLRWAAVAIPAVMAGALSLAIVVISHMRLH